MGVRFVNRVGAFTLSFLALYLVPEGRLSLPGSGLVMSAFGAATIPGRLVGGRLTDRLGRRRTLLLGLGAPAATQVGLAVGRDTTSLVVLAVVLGLVFEVYEPATGAVVADVVPPDQRGAAFSALALSINAGAVVAGVFAALVADIDLRWLFALDGVTGAAAAVLVVTLLPRDTSPTSVVPSRSRGRARTRDTRLGALTASGAIFAVLYRQLFTLLPLTITGRGLSVGTVGRVQAVSALVVLITGPVVHRRLVDRDDRTLVSGGLLLLALGFVVNGLVTTSAGFLGAAVLWTSAGAVVIGRMQAMAANLAPPGATGRYLAVYGISWGVAGIIAPALGTSLLAALGPTRAWALLATTALLLAPAHHRLARLVQCRRCRCPCSTGAVASPLSTPTSVVPPTYIRPTGTGG